MRMALVDQAGLVVGLLEWDVAKSFTPPLGHTLFVAAGARVGDTWAAGGYVPRGVSADNRAALIAKGRAYLALPSPTAAQSTKVLRAMVMLAIEALDNTSGT